MQNVILYELVIFLRTFKLCTCSKVLGLCRETTQNLTTIVRRYCKKKYWRNKKLWNIKKIYFRIEKVSGTVKNFSLNLICRFETFTKYMSRKRVQRGVRDLRDVQ